MLNFQGAIAVGDGKFALELIGPFRLHAPDGARINIASRKGQALLAMLAVAGNGERTRSWLQGQLWGTRAADQAQASLRNEVSTLRAQINGATGAGPHSLLHSDKNRIWLDLSRLTVDVRDPDRAAGHHVFLEGLDIPEEEGFEEWLRGERARVKARQDASGGPRPAAVTAPSDFTARAALAVLPFANLTGDPAQNFLAEGISEDLIDRLARLRWMPIIARGSSFAFRDPDPDPRLVGKALGARYIVEGRVRRLGSDQFLSAALADSDSGQTLWSTKIALIDTGSVAILEDLLTSLTAALGGRIDQEEQSRALRRPQSDLNVRDLIWRGRWHANRLTREDAAAAKACFDEALAR
jgi:TolB-like protein